MNTAKILKGLMVLRDYQKAELEATESMIKEIEQSQEPRKPRKRRNINEELKAKYRNYAVTGKISKKNLLNQALTTNKAI